MGETKTEYEDRLSEKVRYNLEYNVKPPWHRRKEHPRGDQLLALREKGYSVTQMAKAFEVSRTTIHRRLKDYRAQEREEAERKEQEQIEAAVRRAADLEEYNKREAAEQQRHREAVERRKKLIAAQRQAATQAAAEKAAKKANSKWRDFFSIPAQNTKHKPM